MQPIYFAKPAESLYILTGKAHLRLYPGAGTCFIAMCVPVQSIPYH